MFLFKFLRLHAMKIGRTTKNILNKNDSIVKLIKY